jgi:hypothetical protein
MKYSTSHIREIQRLSLPIIEYLIFRRFGDWMVNHAKTKTINE